MQNDMANEHEESVLDAFPTDNLFLEEKNISRSYKKIQSAIITLHVLCIALFLIPIWYKPCNGESSQYVNAFYDGGKGGTMTIFMAIILFAIIHTAFLFIGPKIYLQRILTIAFFLMYIPFAAYLLLASIVPNFISTCNDYYASGLGTLCLAIIIVIMMPLVLLSHHYAKRHKKCIEKMITK